MYDMMHMSATTLHTVPMYSSLACMLTKGGVLVWKWGVSWSVRLRLRSSVRRWGEGGMEREGDIGKKMLFRGLNGWL